MKARVLGASEWGRIEDRGLLALLPHMSREDVRVVVVEDGGEVVGSVGLLRMLHFEGLWISPKHRTAGVARALLRGAADALDGEWAIAAAADERMRSLLPRLGGVKMPLDSYVLRLEAGRF